MVSGKVDGVSVNRWLAGEWMRCGRVTDECVDDWMHGCVGE